ncbi:uncharacterized protein MELLADRAFT_58565 [Melampsora larici-populina 98AG31]|uniref:Uncharacterized protein n=1 Tax=Melampsora larici-populina (strain 98AG31 / pathotype 3-4-7) TaxID=747676 RepID=F4R403_MELLP|nr:uncharacterized protein MELLADRAFT_58565 [Melampsora larici-populina 98AG31]EGG13075.1 hypothetical protein MELLADRAFT_58565 [Melampsora larici-populina 98AG31]
MPPRKRSRVVRSTRKTQPSCNRKALTSTTKKKASPTADNSGDRTGQDNYVPSDLGNNNNKPEDLEGSPPPTNTQSSASAPSPQATHTTDPIPSCQPTNEKLTIYNYSTLGQQLGQPALERMLNDPDCKTQNQLPSAVLAEAQALQGYYTIEKLSLSLVGNTSLTTVKSTLFEGPVACEQNGYTTWLCYSQENTVDISMPAGKQPDGFAKHNQVGRRWTELEEDKKETFQPQLFKRLALAHFASEVTPVPDEERLTDAEHTTYMGFFSKHVNLDKVFKHLQSGVLGQTIANSIAVIEKRGRKEIGKVANQLQKDAKRIHHLAKDFAIRLTATQINSTEITQTSMPSTTVKSKQEVLRTKLTNLLNNEICKNLPNPPQGPKHNVFPKTPNPHDTIARRLFQGIHDATHVPKYTYHQGYIEPRDEALALETYFFRAPSQLYKQNNILKKFLHN